MVVQGQTHTRLMGVWVGSAKVALYTRILSKYTHMTQKFQLGKHSIRKIINIEENKIMYKDDHLVHYWYCPIKEYWIKEKWLSQVQHMLNEKNNYVKSIRNKITSMKRDKTGF